MDKLDLILNPDEILVVSSAIKILQKKIHDNAIDKGRWDGRNALSSEVAKYELNGMRSSLSGVIDAVEEGDPVDSQFDGYRKVDVQLAGVLIRILDFAAARGVSMCGPLMRKMVYDVDGSRY